jgi:hypothetical protein
MVWSKRQFLVRWQGYGANEDTWEPEEYLQNCHHLLDAFLARCQPAPTPDPRQVPPPTPRPVPQSIPTRVLKLPSPPFRFPFPFPFPLPPSPPQPPPPAPPVFAVLEDVGGGQFKVALEGGGIIAMTRDELMKDHIDKYSTYLEDVVFTRFC